MVYSKGRLSVKRKHRSLDDTYHKEGSLISDRDNDDNLSTSSEETRYFDHSRRPSVVTTASSTSASHFQTDLFVPSNTLLSFEKGSNILSDEENERDLFHDELYNEQQIPEIDLTNNEKYLSKNDLEKLNVFVLTKSKSQEIFETECIGKKSSLPNSDNFIAKDASDLLILFHHSKAPQKPLPQMKDSRVKLFANKADVNKYKRGKQCRAWIKTSLQTDDRWDLVTSNLINMNSVSPEVIAICRRMFTSKNKMLKLQILANNQIFGAGGLVKSCIGIPFQEGPSSELIVDVRTSTSTIPVENGIESSIGYNLRHVLQHDIDLTPVPIASSSPKACSGSHIKRPLNSYMLYRGSMMKVANVLVFIDNLTEVVEEIINSYKDGLVNTAYERDNQELYVLKRINDIINDDNEILATKLVDLINKKISKLSKLQKIRHSFLGFVISQLWQTESTTVKEVFHYFSQVEAETHLEMYPGYRYKPSKRQKHS